MEMWRYINRKRGRKTVKENDIKKRKWKEHFKELLGGIELEEKEKAQEDWDWEEEKDGDIQEKEIWDVRRMKKRKTIGIDRIPRYGRVDICGKGFKR